MAVYVVQVTAGQELRHARTVNRAALAEQAVLEAYVPQTVGTRRYGGEWHPDVRQLFPGYVFVQTDDLAGLRRALRAISGPKKLLGTELGPLPLTEEEVAWVDALTAGDRENHTVEMSVGVIVGQRVEVRQGPLMGMEGLIRKVDRHKRTAEIEVQLLGRQARVKVGLEIVSKMPGPAEG